MSSSSSTSFSQRLLGLALFAALVLPAALQAQAESAAASAAQGTGAQKAQADSAQADAPTLDGLDQKIRILERKLEVKEEQEAAQKEQNATVTAGKDGFSLVSADKESVLKFKYFQHTDGRYFFEDGDNKLPNTLLLRRVRPVLEGAVGKYYNFRLQTDFASTFQILDAYGELAYWPWARLRIGKSKTPLGLERIQSSQDMALVEFAHPTSLTPNYDLGISLLGDFLEESYGYYVGVFNGAVDGTSRDVDLNDDKDLIGRVFAQPFKTGNIEPLRGLGVGFAAGWGKRFGDSANAELPSFKTAGQQTFFSYRSDGTAAGTVVADGTRFRLAPQGYFYSGPFGLLAEYVQSKQEVRRGTVVTDLTHTAWQAAGSWVLAGGEPSFRGVSPKQNFDPKNHTWGAFELVARYSKIELDDDTFPLFANPASAARSAEAWAAGINWYLNKSVKVMLDYEATKFDGGSATGDREDENILFSRFQINF